QRRGSPARARPLPVLRRRLPPQPRVDVLGVPRLLQPRQLPAQVARPPEAPAEERLLEPAVEVLHAAVELRLPLGDEHRADAEAEAEADHPRQGPRRCPPAGQFAGVIELDLLRPAQVLPALAQEAEHLVHAPGVGQAQADGAVEGILADPDGVAVAAPPEVDRPDQIDLVQLVGGAGLRAGVVLPGQQWGQAHPWGRQAVALEDALDGALAGEGPDAQGSQLAQDGGGPDEAVAGGRGGVGLEAAADGADGPLQVRRGGLGDGVGAPGQVVEALGAVLQVAMPPLVEPGLDATQGRAEVVDGAAGEAETDGALTRREFVVHGLSSAGQPLAVACGELSSAVSG